MDTYPKVLFIGTSELLAQFQESIPHIPVSKKDRQEIIQQIMIVLLDNFDSFRFQLAQLPDFMPLYPNPILNSPTNRENLAIAVHQLGMNIYTKLEQMGAFAPQARCGGLGFFPYYLDRVIGDDIMLKYIDDEKAS